VAVDGSETLKLAQKSNRMECKALQMPSRKSVITSPSILTIKKRDETEKNLLTFGRVFDNVLSR